MPPKPGPREEGGSGILFLLAPGRFGCDPGDHAAVDAQVIQFACRQAGQFGNRLAINGATGAGFLQTSKQAHDASSGGPFVVGGVGKSVRCSHCFHLRLYRFVFTAQRIRAVGMKMDPMLRLHNGQYLNAAMQQSQCGSGLSR